MSYAKISQQFSDPLSMDTFLKKRKFTNGSNEAKFLTNLGTNTFLKSQEELEASFVAFQKKYNELEQQKESLEEERAKLANQVDTLQTEYNRKVRELETQQTDYTQQQMNLQTQNKNLYDMYQKLYASLQLPDTNEPEKASSYALTAIQNLKSSSQLSDKFLSQLDELKNNINNDTINHRKYIAIFLQNVLNENQNLFEKYSIVQQKIQETANEIKDIEQTKKDNSQQIEALSALFSKCVDISDGMHSKIKDITQRINTQLDLDKSPSSSFISGNTSFPYLLNEDYTKEDEEQDESYESDDADSMDYTDAEGGDTEIDENDTEMIQNKQKRKMDEAFDNKPITTTLRRSRRIMNKENSN
jgi:hypothetical protein